MQILNLFEDNILGVSKAVSLTALTPCLSCHRDIDKWPQLWSVDTFMSLLLLLISINGVRPLLVEN